jgi:lipoprotein-anchoring transpeptidase ErfK/SrfK
MLGHIPANGVAMSSKIVVACALFAAVSPSLSVADAAPRRHQHQAQPPLTTERVNDATTQAKVAPGSSGAATLRAAILLDRAHFSPGEIDTRYGSNLRQAIIGYQSANGLDATGKVDAPTWKALDADAAPALVDYTVTDADVAGPFLPIPTDMQEKAKLPALGYTSALEELGERFHASPQLLQQLNPKARFAQAGETLTVPSVQPTTALPKAAKVVIVKSASTVSLVDAAGKTLAQYPASTGSEHDPLPLGTWQIKGVTRDPVYHYDPSLFWDADQGNPKTKVAAGPNNPVGVVWIDLSKPHYGIHGTPEPSKIGKTESHGCIRLTNWDALEVASAVSAGTPAILQE